MNYMGSEGLQGIGNEGFAGEFFDYGVRGREVEILQRANGQRDGRQ